MTAPARHRAQLALDSIGRAYPRAWRTVDEMRAARGASLPRWPDCVYLPLHGARAIVFPTGSAVDPLRAPDIGRIGALSAWRVTQGIYRFDPTLARALDDTAVPTDVPLTLLRRLPEWCVYVETPGLGSITGRPLAGVWAHLDWDARGHEELRLLYDVDSDGPEWQRYVSLPILLSDGPISDALALVNRSAAQIGVSQLQLPAATVTARLWPLISRLLYLCADDPDYGGRTPPELPEATITKRGARTFAPDHATEWDVGVRIGAAIRRAQSVDASDAISAGGHASPRAHIRRAHWHAWWLGSRDPALAHERRLSVRWLPPIPVNIGDPDALPATVHAVEDSP